jgi:hypothetical protein
MEVKLIYEWSKRLSDMINNFGNKEVKYYLKVTIYIFSDNSDTEIKH